MRALRLAVLAGLLLPGFQAVRAQVETAVGVSPGLLGGGAKEEEKKPDLTPLSLALSLVFDTTTWAAVGVSTAAPASDMAELLRRGYYRLEILQLTLMARDTGKRLSELTAKRAKKESLRKIAKDLPVRYDPVYERAVELAQEVERRIESVSRVSVWTEPPDAPADAGDGKDGSGG
ncbi:MAG: hypothetical protein ABII00_14595 [Elusimicrobiota bacterium]